MLGYGVNAYFDIMLSIMKLFMVISIVVLPLFISYSANDSLGLKEYLKNDSKYMFAKFTIGNMGGSTVFCKSKRIEEGSIFNLNCPNSLNAQMKTLDKDG